VDSSTTLARPLAEEVDAFFHLDPDLIADPYSLYRRIRHEAPVFRHTDKVLVSTYADVREVLTSPKVLQGLAVRGTRYRHAASRVDEQHRIQLAEMFGFLEKRLGGTNGEYHNRLRRLAQKAFTPKMIARMQERIENIAEGLLDGIETKGDVELIEDYAYHLPLMVISEMLDISTDDRDDLRHWAGNLGTFVGAEWTDTEIVERTHDSVFKLRSYLTSVFDSRRGGDTTDLLGALIAAEGDDGDHFTEDELVAMITQFIFAGHETSTMFLGNSLVRLLGEYREQWDMLCQEPDLIPNGVEELLRFESPTHNIDKLAGEDFEIGGVQIEQWDTINVMIASANHDEDVTPGADRLDITRKDVNHMTFGFGAHHCLGAALARMEAQVSLRAITRRFPSMRLATETTRWRKTHMNRGPEVLPVILRPGLR
jgi:cytochrome P450